MRHNSTTRCFVLTALVLSVAACDVSSLNYSDYKERLESSLAAAEVAQHSSHREDADFYYKQALQLAQKFGPNTLLLADVQCKYAAFEEENGQLERAKELYQAVERTIDAKGEKTLEQLDLDVASKFGLARVAELSGEKTALALYKLALDAATEPHYDGKLRGTIVNKYAQLLRASGRAEEARDLQTQFDLLNNPNNESLRLNAFHAGLLEGLQLVSEGNAKQGGAMIDDAIDAAQKVSPETDVMNALLHMGDNYLYQGHKIPEAICLYEKVIAHKPSKDMEALALYGLGDAYNLKGTLSQSEASYRRAVSIRKSMPTSEENQIELARCLDNLSIVLMEQNKIAQCLEAGKQACKVIDTTSNIHLRVLLLSHLGENTRRSGNFNEALSILKKALSDCDQYTPSDAVRRKHLTDQIDAATARKK